MPRSHRCGRFSNSSAPTARDIVSTPWSRESPRVQPSRPANDPSRTGSDPADHHPRLHRSPAEPTFPSQTMSWPWPASSEFSDPRPLPAGKLGNQCIAKLATSTGPAKQGPQNRSVPPPPPALPGIPGTRSLTWHSTAGRQPHDRSVSPPESTGQERRSRPSRQATIDRSPAQAKQSPAASHGQAPGKRQPSRNFKCDRQSSL